MLNSKANNAAYNVRNAFFLGSTCQPLTKTYAFSSVCTIIAFIKTFTAGF